jgi:hypothetical protein
MHPSQLYCRNHPPTHVSIAADIAGAKVKVINNPKAKWTNLSAKGTFGGILVAAGCGCNTTSLYTN